MITIDSQPGELSFSGNDIIFQFKSNSYLTDSGGVSNKPPYYTTTAQINIAFLTPSPNIVAGDYLTFSWSGKSITLTCATTPDNSGLQFAPQAVNSTLHSVIANLLRNNFEFSRDFETFASTGFTGSSFYGAINIKARSYGNKGLSISKSAMSYITISVTNGHEFKLKENYKIIVSLYSRPELYTEDATTLHDHVITVEADVDQDGNAFVNFTENIEAYLETKFPATSRLINENNILNNIKAFYIKYAESYGANRQVYLMSKSSIFYAIIGGIKKQDVRNVGLYLTDYLRTNNMFLTWLPLSRTYHQDEKISFLNPELGSIINWAGTVIYEDGTTSPFSGFPITLNTYQTYTFKVKTIFDYINSLNPSKAISSFSFAILLGGIDISQTVTYTIDKKYRPTQKAFAYLNSFGVPEIFVTNGDISETVEMESSIFQNYLPPTYSSVAPELTPSDIEQTEKIQVASGYISADHKNALKDFMRAKNKWEIISGGYIPIVANIKSEAIYKTKDKVFSYTFEYQYAYNNTYYSEA